MVYICYCKIKLELEVKACTNSTHEFDSIKLKNGFEVE